MTETRQSKSRLSVFYLQLCHNHTAGNEISEVSAAQPTVISRALGTSEPNHKAQTLDSDGAKFSILPQGTAFSLPYMTLHRIYQQKPSLELGIKLSDRHTAWHMQSPAQVPTEHFRNLKRKRNTEHVKLDGMRGCICRDC